MQDVVIVTGSGHGLPEEIINEYGIKIFHYGIHIGDEAFSDGVDIKLESMLKLMYEKGIAPKTSAPSIGELVNIIESIKKEGKSPVFVVMSSLLTAATYEALENAKRKTGADIEVVDTKQVASAKELIVIEAATAARAGKDMKEVAGHARKVAARTNSVFGVPDLKYLHLSGRIGRAVVLMGSMMKVIPIVAIRDMEGAVAPVGRARNVIQVNQKIVEVIKGDLKKFNADRVKTIIIGHSDNREAASSLRKAIDKNISYGEMLEMEFGCVATAQAGPKTWGAGYYIE